MKAKLLKRLRRIGRDQVTIYSVTMSRGIIVGMNYGHDGSYHGLFEFGDTEEMVRNKACALWLRRNLDAIRIKYKKYTRLYSRGRNARTNN